jgi:hypothetical protein
MIYMNQIKERRARVLTLDRENMRKERGGGKKAFSASSF